MAGINHLVRDRQTQLLISTTWWKGRGRGGGAASNITGMGNMAVSARGQRGQYGSVNQGAMWAIWQCQPGASVGNMAVSTRGQCGQYGSVNQGPVGQ